MTSRQGEAATISRAAGNSSACRGCGMPLTMSFVDLGKSPLCESYISAGQLDSMEPFHPLHAFVCTNCYLVQLHEYVTPEHIFSEYAYFSSYSDTWLDHARKYVDEVTERFSLNQASQVVEVASNDGYLLQYFLRRGVPVLGIEPARNIARVATDKGVPTVAEFFGVRCATKLSPVRADLMIANNVLAHVPDVHDFLAGFQIMLKPEGVLTIEFPHLVNMVEQNQFDTIYHEHFSYLSLFSAERLLAAHGLKVFDLEELPTHGGSLRLFVSHAGNGFRETGERVLELRGREARLGVASPEYYLGFRKRVEQTKRKLLTFLIDAKERRKTVAGYGAPGKGNTLLNYCGIRTDLLDYTVDRNPYKQGKFLPGTNIPVYHPDRIAQTRPDYVLILPWNLKDEIVRDLSYIRDWNGQFVLAIPHLTVW